MKKLLLIGVALLAFSGVANAKTPVMPSQFIGTWCDSNNKEVNSCIIVSKTGFKGFESSCDLKELSGKNKDNIYHMQFICEVMDGKPNLLKEFWQVNKFNVLSTDKDRISLVCGRCVSDMKVYDVKK